MASEDEHHESDQSIDRNLLREYLADRSEPCPSCNYDLRGLTGKHCPECGQALRLHVGLVSPNMGAFITGLVGLSAGVGFNGLMLIYCVVGSIIYGFVGFVDSYLIVTGSGLLISLPLMLVWIRKRGIICRQQKARRITLTGLCWIVPSISLIASIVILIIEK